MDMILLSAIAGVLGMGIGAAISAILLKRPSDTMICWLLSFAGGVMTSVVTFGLIPEAFELADPIVSVTGVLLGIVVIMALNRIVDRISETRSVHRADQGQVSKDRARMLRSGILMLIAIGLHNIPEGIAIGAAGTHDYRLGALLAFMLALHNIPEGMAIAAPLLAGGIHKGRVILLTALCGGTTVLGGLIGVFVGSISDFTIALSLSSAGGAMLYIVFGEMMPQAIGMSKNRTASIVMLLGILVGLVATHM